MAKDLRARDSIVKELAEKLSETAVAAEAAASAAHTMDHQRRIALAEVERVKEDLGKQLKSSMSKVLINFVIQFFTVIKLVSRIILRLLFILIFFTFATETVAKGVR